MKIMCTEKVIDENGNYAVIREMKEVSDCPQSETEDSFMDFPQEEPEKKEMEKKTSLEGQITGAREKQAKESKKNEKENTREMSL